MDIIQEVSRMLIVLNREDNVKGVVPSLSNQQKKC